MPDKMLLTAEGLKKLKEELHELETKKRKEVAERLQEAISYGDLSENAEYEEAKNEQAFVEGRIIELKFKIKNAQVVGASKTHGDIVNLGSSVTVENLTNKKDGQLEYHIVGTTEVVREENKISNESPLGKALIGHKKGDVVEFSAPAGNFEYKILKIA